MTTKKTISSKSKICKTCSQRRPLSAYGKLSRSTDGTGHNITCLKCIGSAIRNARSKNSKVPDAAVNGALAKPGGPNGALMTAVNRTVVAMRKSGTPRLTIDIAAGTIEILTPEKFRLGGEG